MSLTPEELSEKIKEARAKQVKRPLNGISSNEDTGIGSQALMAGLEIVSAVCVGSFFGYWADKLFGTAPFGMIIMFFAGFVAGFMNVYRSQMGVGKK